MVRGNKIYAMQRREYVCFHRPHWPDKLDRCVKKHKEKKHVTTAPREVLKAR